MEGRTGRGLDRSSSWPKRSRILGLTVFTGYFLNYAQTEIDV